MKVSIIVPAHNEEENLPELMKRLEDTAESIGDAEIILVDDHSTDSTPGLCDSYVKGRKNVRTVHRSSGDRGMGNALKEGTRAARGNYIIWTMADLCDDLSSVPGMISALDGGADMVFASRYMHGGNAGDLEGFKRLMSWGFSRMSRMLLGLPVHDVTNAYRAFRKDVFYEVKPGRGDFTISPEFSLLAHLAGYRLAEVPTSYSKRKRGVASFKILKMSWRYSFILAWAVWKRSKALIFPKGHKAMTGQNRHTPQSGI